MGVHAYAPNLAINGDIGWTSCNIRRKAEMIRLWNRLISFDDSRITKQVLIHDLNNRGNNWSKEIKQISIDVGMIEYFENMLPMPVEEIKMLLYENQKNAWKENIVNVPKLRTYIKYKTELACEPYVNLLQDRGKRSIMAQFRSGILPLSVETGRYSDVPLEFRLCLFCQSQEIENETHFIFYCACYEELRSVLIEKAKLEFNDFNDLDNDSKLVMLMGKKLVKETATYLHSAFYKRQSILYK